MIMTGALLVVTLTQPFLARAGEIEERQKRQQGRIAEGIESGTLTPKEGAKLEREEAKIQREKRRFKRNDGRLGPKERAKLNKDLNKASKDIYKEKHD
ncbi:MAG: hypothetical protein HY278_00500 [candidate division NC10 bacterium]|nr:hypothetical protein [candidate division NC10 bacterium]